MIIDFHVHGKITSSIPFDSTKFLQTVNEARENGMNALAVTEHLKATNFLDGYDFLKSNYPRIDDYFDIDGFKVFYGMEVSTIQNYDILIIGSPELVFALREEISDHLNEKKCIDIDKLFNLNISDKMLVILAHPYRNHIDFPEINKNILSRLDAIELNSKDCYNEGINVMKKKLTKLSEKFKLPITCGSDTHCFIQISSAKNIFNKDCSSIVEIKNEIKEGNYKIKMSSELYIRVKCALAIKKIVRNKEY